MKEETGDVPRVKDREEERESIKTQGGRQQMVSGIIVSVMPAKLKKTAWWYSLIYLTPEGLLSAPIPIQWIFFFFIISICPDSTLLRLYFWVDPWWERAEI